MVTDERRGEFLRSLYAENTPMLKQIEREARERFVPVVSRETQELLKFLLAVKRPRQILEVGTAVGFSALLMAEYNPVPCRITTIEKYEKRIPLARENFARARREDQITLIAGDAADVLAGLDGSFDLIFMDAAKGQYIRFLEDVLRLLAPGGLLVSDDVLLEGDVIESRYEVVRRNRTIHSRMREYLRALTRREELTTVVLPLGDGVAVSVKGEPAEEPEPGCDGTAGGTSEEPERSLPAKGCAESHSDMPNLTRERGLRG